MKYNYIAIINNFWRLNGETPIGGNPTVLYFYLLNKCNSLGWKENFRQSDRHISVQIGLSVNTIRSAKIKLKEFGLIDFKSPEKQSRGLEGSTIYTILLPSETVSTTVLNIDTVSGDVSGFEQETVSTTVSTTVSNFDTRNKLKETNIKNKQKEKKDFSLSFDNDVLFFEEFRKAYPGSKRGLETEFNQFKKKHKDWKKVLPLLLPSINQQIGYYNALRNNGSFAPSYPLLQTWLNQRRWEMELSEEVFIDDKEDW